MSTDIQQVAQDNQVATGGYGSIVHKVPLQDIGESSFLPRLQLCIDNSEAVIYGKIPRPGYAIVSNKDEYDFLGDEVDIYPITVRNKALDLSDRSNIIAIFDPEDEEFKRIKEDSNIRDAGCMWGYELLCWCPAIKGPNKFCTLFMGNKSARIEAKKFSPILDNHAFAKLKHRTVQKEVEGKKRVWKAHLILPYSGTMVLPSEDEVIRQVERFVNPDAVVKESANSVVDDNAERPR